MKRQNKHFQDNHVLLLIKVDLDLYTIDKLQTEVYRFLNVKCIIIECFSNVFCLLSLLVIT